MNEKDSEITADFFHENSGLDRENRPLSSILPIHNFDIARSLERVLETPATSDSEPVLPGLGDIAIEIDQIHSDLKAEDAELQKRLHYCVLNSDGSVEVLDVDYEAIRNHQTRIEVLVRRLSILEKAMDEILGT